MVDHALEAEIARLREGMALDESGPLFRLFEFLVARTLADQTPKETEIAIEVFGKDAAIVSAGDSAVRVYIHRLRRRLEEFYLRRGDAAGPQLVIPKGEYRLVLLAGPVEAKQPVPRLVAVWRSLSRPWLYVAAACAALVLVNLSIWAWVGSRHTPVSAHPALSVWNDFSQNGLPLMIVVGDYYLVGESDDGMNINRLVREFDINSREDLTDFAANSPQKAARYVDVGLAYLPVSTSISLHTLASSVPGFDAGQIVMASKFSAEFLKSHNILYIGWLSGLGPLRESVFAASRFSIGQSYDEIVDRTNDQHYIAQSARDIPDNTMYRDYAYISSFRGPTGNRITIVAGTRDSAVQDAAETVSQREKLAKLLTAVGMADSFEALYEVDSLRQANFDSRLIAAGPLDPKHIWAAERAMPAFPPG